MLKSLVSKIIFVSVMLSGLLVGMAVASAQSVTTGAITLTGKYHADANKIVNAKINQVFNYFENIDLSDPNYLPEMQKKLTPPNDLADSTQCIDNLTSICLQQELNRLYLEYQSSVVSLSKVQSNDAIFLQEQLNLIPELNTQSLEFYRQILFSYPLHIQNTKIITNLEALIDNLKDIENAMQPYSNKFHNVTTAYCQ